MCIYGRWLKNYLGHRGCRAVIFSLAKFSKLYPYSAKFEWKQCSWSPWLTIDHHRREPSAEGTRHLNILKNRVSETEFPAILHDFGAKMQGRLRYKIEVFHNRGRSAGLRVRMRVRPAWGPCLPILEHPFPTSQVVQWRPKPAAAKMLRHRELCRLSCAQWDSTWTVFCQIALHKKCGIFHLIILCPGI